MSTETDATISAFLTEITATMSTKRESRLEEKWPEYRETDSATRRKEIIVQYYRRTAIRWARVWLPATADRELRQVETLLERYLEHVAGFEGDDDLKHRRSVQGLVNLGNALATVLRAVQGGNQAARQEAIERVASAVGDGESTAVILERAGSFQPDVRQEEGDPNDVRD